MVRKIKLAKIQILKNFKRNAVFKFITKGIEELYIKIMVSLPLRLKVDPMF